MKSNNNPHIFPFYYRLDLMSSSILRKRDAFFTLLGEQHDDDDLLPLWINREQYNRRFFFSKDLDPTQDPRKMAPLAAFLHVKFVILRQTRIYGQDIAVMDALVRNTPRDFYKSYSAAALILRLPEIASVVFGIVSKKALFAKPSTTIGYPPTRGLPGEVVPATADLWTALMTHVITATQDTVYADLLLFTARERFPELVNTTFLFQGREMTTLEHLLSDAIAHGRANEDFFAALIEVQDDDTVRRLEFNVLQQVVTLKSVRLTKMVYDRLSPERARIRGLIQTNRRGMNVLQTRKGRTEAETKDLVAMQDIDNILSGRHAYVFLRHT